MIGDQYCQYGSATFFKGLRITKHDNTKNKPLTKSNVNDGDGQEDETKHETERFVKMKTKSHKRHFVRFLYFASLQLNSINKGSKTFIIAMGDCIPVRPWHDSPIECLAEVRMIWRDKSEQSLLLSLRLYFLPENTSKGRVGHGEVRSNIKRLRKWCEREKKTTLRSLVHDTFRTGESYYFSLELRNHVPLMSVSGNNTKKNKVHTF